ncbi:MAG: phosphodiester glycosidase family protein [Pirellulales bacterium]
MPHVTHRLVLLLSIVILRVGTATAQDARFDWSNARQLYPGIRYARVEAQEPRKMIIHAAQIDHAAPGLKLHVTPRRAAWESGKAETDRQTTRDFLRAARQRGVPMVLAVNADAFSPWPAPWDQSTPTDLLGLAVADGVRVSRAAGTPSLLLTKSGRVQIESTPPDFDDSQIEAAVSGFALCLDEGRPLPGGDDLHPRTGIGLSADGRYLLLVVIDGRQPNSLGATTPELGRWLLQFGAWRGINMDGGGSSTLAWWNPAAEEDERCELLNRPVGNGVRADRFPPALFLPSERANGNNLGVSLAAPP